MVKELVCKTKTSGFDSHKHMGLADFERLATAKSNRHMLARVLDDLLRMSEGKEHASSLADFERHATAKTNQDRTNTDSKDYRPSKL